MIASFFELLLGLVRQKPKGKKKGRNKAVWVDHPFGRAITQQLHSKIRVLLLCRRHVAKRALVSHRLVMSRDSVKWTPWDNEVASQVGHIRQFCQKRRHTENEDVLCWRVAGFGVPYINHLTDFMARLRPAPSFVPYTKKFNKTRGRIMLMISKFVL